MKISYDSIGRSIHMQCNVDSIPDRDKINLLYHLLTQLEVPIDQSTDTVYEAYQQAAKVILDRANEVWWPVKR